MLFYFIAIVHCHLAFVNAIIILDIHYFIPNAFLLRPTPVVFTAEESARQSLLRSSKILREESPGSTG